MVDLYIKKFAWENIMSITHLLLIGRKTFKLIGFKINYVISLGLRRRMSKFRKERKLISAVFFKVTYYIHKHILVGLANVCRWGLKCLLNYTANAQLHLYRMSCV